MKNKKSSVKSVNSVNLASLIDSNLSESTRRSSKLSQQMLSYYKGKCEKLEKDFEYFGGVLEEVKSACDLSDELHRELSERNDEVSKLQHIVGELQIHLFREKEQNLKLSAENDELKIQDYENKKRIKALLMVTGVCERKSLHFVTKSSQDKLIEPKLPKKLQELKEAKQKEALKESDEIDPQILLLNNHLLASQLEHHIKITRDEINVLLKEKDVSHEERKIERQRLQRDIDLLASKLKESQDLLCKTTGKLLKSQQAFEKEKAGWMEEKDRFLQAINVLEGPEGVDVSEIVEYCVSGVWNSKLTQRFCSKKDAGKDGSPTAEKEQMAGFYREQVFALEAEVNRLRERAQICKNTFKRKTEKMTAQVCYLKNKYEDLDRRRQLEAEGFRTDIRMLRERVKELEKKLAKASSGFQSSEQQQLLISARSTLNRAKQLEKELAHMKSKISALEANEVCVL